MSTHYRSLTPQEIDTLRMQGCTAADWGRVLVAESFVPQTVERVRFYGDVRLGAFRAGVKCPDGLVRSSGIREAELSHVTVADDVLIEQVGCIAGYDIGYGACLRCTGSLTMEGETSFGVGTPVSVLSEGSDFFQVMLHPSLGAQEACLHTLLTEGHKALDEAVEGIRRTVAAEARHMRRHRGYVGEGVAIVNAGVLRNVFVGCGTVIDGAQRLEEVYLCEAPGEGIYIGPAVILRHSVVQAGTEVTDGAKVADCLVGQHVHIGKGFSAESSLFFANSYMDNGEACAVCAGPFSVSHHKSSLLIGCLCSFANFGSGTNMSNHMYKLGPLHYGALGRGCKTASGSHLVWPARLGDFSMVMGKCDVHDDLSAFPFSYVIRSGEKVHLVPGVNFATVGTYRDAAKWPLRDGRKNPSAGVDCISTYHPLNPYTVWRVLQGRDRLRQLLLEQGVKEEYTDGKVFISSRALHRGIELYTWIEQLYLGRYLSMDTPEREPCKVVRWYDMLGCIVTDTQLQHLCSRMAGREPLSAETVCTLFHTAAQETDALARAAIMATYTPGERTRALKDYAANLQRYYDTVLADMEKEWRMGGAIIAPAAAAFRQQLQKDKEEALKKAKEEY